MMVGDRLRKWRKENKISGQKLAEATNVSQSIISYYELNRSSIPSEFLVKLYEIYNLDIIWLLTGKEPDSTDFTQDELELIEYYRNCTRESKTAVKKTAEALQSIQPDTSNLSTSRTG